MPEEKIQPPGRLQAVLDLIPGSAQVVADIGYDHGRLIKRLLRDRPQTRLIGVERQPGLDRRFWASLGSQNPAELSNWQSRVDLRFGDGLDPLRPGEADCLVFAGLGEPAILEILHNGRDKLAGVGHMIFAPAPVFVGMAFDIRRFGWYISREVIAAQGRHFYRIQLAQPGTPPAPAGLLDYFGPTLFQQKNPFIYEYLLYVKKRLAATIANTGRQSGPLRHFCENIDQAIELAAAFSRQR